LELGRCIKSGNRPYADLVKSGYNNTSKAQTFIDPSLCLAIQWKPHVWIWQFFDLFSLSLLGTENMQKHFFSFFFLFLFFHFTFWRYMSSTQRLVISRQTLTSSAFLYRHTVKCNILQCPLAPILWSWALLSCPHQSSIHTKLWSIVVFTCLRFCRQSLGEIFLKVGSLGVIVANPLPYMWGACWFKLTTRVLPVIWLLHVSFEQRELERGLWYQTSACVPENI
jgi:hypothetical protein